MGFGENGDFPQGSGTHTVRCSGCGRTVMAGLDECPYCLKKLNVKKKPRRGKIIAAVAACVVLIACAVGIYYVKLVSFAQEQEKVRKQAEAICETYGLKAESSSIELAYQGEKGTRLYHVSVVTTSEKGVSYGTIYKILEKMDDLEFDSPFVSSSWYVHSGSIKVNDDYYNAYDGVLNKNSVYNPVYTADGAGTTTASSTRTTAKSTRTYTTKSRNGETTAEDYYSVKDYGNPDDFYEDYWDEFDNYEDAEDYFYEHDD